MGMTDETAYTTVTVSQRTDSTLRQRDERLQEILDSATDEERAEYERELARASNYIADEADRIIAAMIRGAMQGSPGLPTPRM